MKKHIMSGYGKNYLNVDTNGCLIDHEYELVRIHTFCGKEYATVEEARSANVYKSVAKDDAEVCKSCMRWQRDAKDRHQSMLDRQAGSQWKEMQRI